MSGGRLNAAAVQQVIDTLPFARSLGIIITTDASDGRLSTRLPYAASVVGNPKVPALHGGALASLMQISATAELIRATGAAKPPRMFSITAEYLRSAALEDTIGTAVVVSRSRRFANLRVELRQPSSERVVAAATVQFRLVD